MTFYPNVKKNGPSESNLCWAAACANVLSQTGWIDRSDLLDEYDLYNQYKNRFGNEMNSIMTGVNYFFSDILHFKYNPREAVRIIPPRQIYFCGNMPKKRQSAALEVIRRNGAKHVLTCYEIQRSIAEKFASDDPRRYRSAIYVDSDFSEDIETLFLTYDAKKHFTSVEYRDDDWELYCVVLLSPPVGNSMI